MPHHLRYALLPSLAGRAPGSPVPAELHHDSAAWLHATLAGLPARGRRVVAWGRSARACVTVEEAAALPWIDAAGVWHNLDLVKVPQ